MHDFSQRDKTYYEKMGLGNDEILRCQECKKIVKTTILSERGCCPKCGNTRMGEIRTLSFWEMFRIRYGFLRFQHSDLFLKEFSNEK